MFDGGIASKHERRCQYCGGLFHTHKKRQKFCSLSCSGRGAVHPQRPQTGMWLTLDAEMTSLWAEGNTAIQIAAHFSEHGITKNAVIGRIHRLKLPKRTQPERMVRPKRAARPKCFAGALRGGNRSARVPGSILNARLRIAPVKPAAQPIPQSTKTFAEMDRDHCWYAHGHSPDWAFCGLPVAIEGTSWCEEHRQLCFQPLRPNPERLVWRSR
jgi:hypothetical protein